jgi:hypothetical protein
MLSNLESFGYNTYGYNGRMTLVPVDDLIEMLSLRCPDLKARIRVIYTQNPQAYLF